MQKDRVRYHRKIRLSDCDGRGCVIDANRIVGYIEPVAVTCVFDGSERQLQSIEILSAHIVSKLLGQDRPVSEDPCIHDPIGGIDDDVGVDFQHEVVGGTRSCLVLDGNPRSSKPEADPLHERSAIRRWLSPCPIAQRKKEEKR